MTNNLLREITIQRDLLRPDRSRHWSPSAGGIASDARWRRDFVKRPQYKVLVHGNALCTLAVFLKS